MEFEIKVVKIDNGIRSDVKLNDEMPVVEMKRIRFKLLAAAGKMNQRIYDETGETMQLWPGWNK